MAREPKVLFQQNSTGTGFIVPYGTPRNRWSGDCLWIGSAYHEDIPYLLHEFDPDFYEHPDTPCVHCGVAKHNIRTSDAEGGQWFCSMECLREHFATKG